VNVRDADGDTPLHKAAWRGHAAVVSVLLAHKADTAIKDNAGSTALDEAKTTGSKAVADLLAKTE